MTDTPILQASPEPGALDLDQAFNAEFRQRAALTLGTALLGQIEAGTRADLFASQLQAAAAQNAELVRRADELAAQVAALTPGQAEPAAA